MSLVQVTADFFKRLAAQRTGKRAEMERAASSEDVMDCVMGELLSVLFAEIGPAAVSSRWMGAARTSSCWASW